MTRVSTPEPQLESLAWSLSKPPATPATTDQMKLQIELLEALRGTPTTEIRLRKLEKWFAKIYANNILLSQQNKLLFAENRIRKISKSKSHRLISSDGRLMTKEAALSQQIAATDQQREKLRKIRHRTAKKEYQVYLRAKNIHRKTLPKHKFIILGDDNSTCWREFLAGLLLSDSSDEMEIEDDDEDDSQDDSQDEGGLIGGSGGDNEEMEESDQGEMSDDDSNMSDEEAEVSA